MTVAPDVQAVKPPATRAEKLAELHKLLAGRRVIVASNRAPYSTAGAKSSSSLVPIIDPVLGTLERATWVAVEEGPVAETPVTDARYGIERVFVERGRYWRHYGEFCNGVVLPVCEVMNVAPRYQSEAMDAYLEVNQAVADRIAFLLANVPETEPEPVVLIQDFHLAFVPKFLRGRRVRARVGVFWHVTWPGLERLAMLPAPFLFLEALLDADAMFFHTPDDAGRFALAARHYRPRTNGTTLCGAAAGAIDFEAWAEAGRLALPLVPRLRDSYDVGRGKRIALSVERADPFKGILQKLDALEALLIRKPEIAAAWQCVLIASPTRQGVPHYDRHMNEIKEAAERVNVRAGTMPGQPFVLLLTRAFSAEEVAAWYGMADVLLVTSLSDGMNLTVKEYVAVRAGQALVGAVVLSQFTGACATLPDDSPGRWFRVSPYAPDIAAGTIWEAMTSPAQRVAEHFGALRTAFENHTCVDWWLGQVKTLCGTK